MKQIIIKALNSKGLSAIKEHIKDTNRAKAFILRLNGVTQELINDSLVITMDGKRVRDMEQFFPDKLNEFFEENMTKLTDSINKMGVEQDRDYTIKVI